MSDNVVEFPKKKNPVQEHMDKLKEVHDQVTELKSIRQSGLEKIAKAVKSLEDNDKINAEHMTPATVESVRDLRTSVANLLNVVDAQDQMIDMVINDLVTFIQNFEQHSVAFYQSSIMLQAMGMLLVEKGALTAEELEARQKEILGQLRTARQKAKDTESEQGGPEG